VSAEQAALDVLRQTLASESLAVLAPRLANLNTWLRREAPPDPSAELERLAARRVHLERHARPGVLTRTGRDDRRRLRQLDERQRRLEQAANQRDVWLEEHADAFAYRDELARRVAARRHALGLHAIVDQPNHLVDLLGPLPDDDTGRARWARAASGIEVYREQWSVDPKDLHQPPIDRVQHRHWTASVETVVMQRRLDALEVGHGIDRSLGIEL
jgi:hypothetical protein